MTVTLESDWHNGSLSDIPIIIFALLVLVFCTWEGVHVGLQLPNINSK